MGGESSECPPNEMLKQAADQFVVLRRLSQKSWAQKLLTWLALSFVSIFVFQHLAYREARIAEREKVVTGTIIAVHKGKGDPTDYTFPFEGRSYLGNDRGDYLDLTAGGRAKVFVDPQNPQTSGLRSFRFKSKVNHDCMNFAIYLSVALSILFAILWLRALDSGEMDNIAEDT
jgi:hypothetical protein